MEAFFSLLNKMTFTIQEKRSYEGTHI